MHKSKIIFRKVLSEDYKSILILLAEVKWTGFPFINDQDLFKKFINNVDRSVVALEGSRIVGFSSAICNDVSIGYVTMCAVVPDKQGKGIGSRLVKILIGNNPDIKWVLSCRPEKVEFWKKNGFRVDSHMMVKNRRIDISPNHTDFTTKKTFKEIIRTSISRIYRFNIYQLHQCIKRLISKTTNKNRV